MSHYYQGYGTQYRSQPQHQQYLYQNHGYQSQHFGASAYEDEARASSIASQPTASPRQPLLAMPMPRVVPLHQSRFIIVQPAPEEPEQAGCCAEISLCRCVDWLLTGVCYVILILVLLAFLLGLLVFFKRHYDNY